MSDHDPPTLDDGPPDVATLLECTRVLEKIIEDRSALVHLDPDQRRAFLMAAGRVSRPERNEQRRLAKARRREARAAKRRFDEELLSQTGIRTLRRAPVYPTPPVLPGEERTAPGERPPPEPAPELQGDRRCYVCKIAFRELHHFYDQMCPICAEVNFERRTRTADLSGKVALITGARVKIGYHAAIKLLRAGAEVWVTTRFPRDAARRFALEPDYADYRDRLSIYGLDLRHTPSVERFCTHILETAERLDYIINNACQTVRRPPGFYRHLMDAERDSVIDDRVLPLLAKGAEWTEPVESAELSQVPLLPSERGEDLTLFPAGELDADEQQIDHREVNSWRLTLDEVPAVELLEVHLVNAVAPFLLNGRLRPLMRRTEGDKHIVNVSAMEGQFYRSFKTDRHPHTNMAKAALNMMTRTSASDYIADRIHMNSVDTGWITDEDPIVLAAKKTEEHGFHPPLDIVDGAARIVDPIFDGVLSGEHVYGLFLKDYRAIPW